MTEEQIIALVEDAIHDAIGLSQHLSDASGAARAVVALLGPAPLEWGPDRTMPSRLAAEIGEWGEYVISEVGDADDPRYCCRAWFSSRFSYVISSSEGLPWHRTESAAKAAAEAHHRAAWWAQTVAGKGE